MSNDNRNLILAVVLSLVVMLGWQYFVAGPQMKAHLPHPQTAAQAPAPGAPQQSAGAAHLSRDQALERSGARIHIDTPSVDGSLLLKGARFDDLRLKKYRETVAPKSPEIVLFSPRGSAFTYSADFAFVAQTGAKIPVPGADTVWTQVGQGALAPVHPVTLTWDNGRGLVFTRTITVDDKFLFTVDDRIGNRTGAKAVLYPYATVARDGVPTSQ